MGHGRHSLCSDVVTLRRSLHNGAFCLNLIWFLGSDDSLAPVIIFGSSGFTGAEIQKSPEMFASCGFYVLESDEILKNTPRYVHCTVLRSILQFHRH